MAKSGVSPVVYVVAGVTTLSLLGSFAYVALREPARELPAPPSEPAPPPPPDPVALAAAADANPEDPVAWAKLCAITAQAYWRDSSFADCDKAVALQPEAVQPQLDRAFLNLKTGRSDRAMSGFEAVLKREPSNAFALFGRSLIHAQFKRMDDSIRDRTRAIGIDVDVVLKLEETYGFKVPWELRR